jgi:hypothetical protein
MITPVSGEKTEGAIKGTIEGAIEGAESKNANYRIKGYHQLVK